MPGAVPELRIVLGNGIHIIGETRLQMSELRDDALDERFHCLQSLFVNLPQASFLRQMGQHFVELPARRVLGLRVTSEAWLYSPRSILNPYAIAAPVILLPSWPMSL